MSDQETQTVVNRFNVGIFFSLAEENELSRTEEREWVRNHPFFTERTDIKLVSHEKGKYLAYVSAGYDKLYDFAKYVIAFRQIEIFSIYKVRMGVSSNFEKAGIYTYIYDANADKMVCTHENKEKSIEQFSYMVYSPVVDKETRVNDVRWALDTRYLTHSLEFYFKKPDTLKSMILAVNKKQFAAVFKAYCAFLVAIGKQWEFRSLALLVKFHKHSKTFNMRLINPLEKQNEQPSNCKIKERR